MTDNFFVGCVGGCPTEWKAACTQMTDNFFVGVVLGGVLQSEKQPAH